MANGFTQKVPVWFTVVAVILLLWGLMGCASFYAHMVYGPALDPNATDWDREYYAAEQTWQRVVYAIAVVTGLLGSIALLAKSKWAVTLYAVSLVAVVVMFGYIFLATELIAVKGVWTTYFPALVFVVGAFQLWFAAMARGRAWIG
ncbi:hypothetical protein [Sphingomonas sp. LT1P40]|uniref:hypothetical protein n=1 Tax=Alteristakelama amylovorans TaxID=3096166 RepID=UPI002FC7D338